MTISKLKKWFVEEKRELPWRNNPSPYAVWVSEVMLQQTQAAVVVPYFERWMEQFPTIASLAQAPLDEVIKSWEGLGYYSRARNLHAGAKKVLECYGGQLPDTYEELSTIKGLGPYTIGAILSFAFHKKVAAVDGNVLRVLSRYLMIEDDISKASTVQKIRIAAEALLPDEEPWVISEALIELGATLCTRKPQCLRCPLQDSCKALACDAVDRLPYKSQRIAIQPLFRTVMIIRSSDHLLVQRRSEGEIMSDLHEFPFIETPEDKHPMSHRRLLSHISSQWGLKVLFRTALPSFKQSFTRYRALLTPLVFECAERLSIPNGLWLNISAASEAAFSSGHRRILDHILTHEIKK
jgi:A/G-specific adenine glycosylase